MLIKNGQEMGEVSDLEYMPGRHDVSFEPDFCGSPNVKLGERRPDTVSFRCARELKAGEAYDLALEDGQVIKIESQYLQEDPVTAIPSRVLAGRGSL